MLEVLVHDGVLEEIVARRDDDERLGGDLDPVGSLEGERFGAVERERVRLNDSGGQGSTTNAMRMIRSRLSALFILKAPGSYSSKVDPVEKKSEAASSVALVM